MRKAIAVLLTIAATLPLQSSQVTDQVKQNREALRQQRSDDDRARGEILAQLERFLAAVNGATEKENGVTLTAPLAPDKVEGIDTTGHCHSEREADQALYAFISKTGVRLRTEPSGTAAVTGRLDKGEKVELLAKSDREEMIQGASAPWILVKRFAGQSGWVFGHYITTRDPLAKSDDAEVPLSKLAIPSRGIVTSAFGYRVDPVTGRKGAFHSGIDIASPAGTPVKAAADGIVRECGFFKNGYGNLVVVEHDRDLCTYYGHLARIDVRRGQKVARSQHLGTVGATGKTTGPHLHFEVRRGDTALDPATFLR
jgi:murein DD-endopeptidase MepM/ murein hydrolase activator NlpD